MRKFFRYSLARILVVGSASAEEQEGSANASSDQSTQPSKCVTNDSFKAAFEQYTQGEGALSANDPNGANRLANDGLKALGLSYMIKPTERNTPPPIDDTEMYLGSADMLERDGRIKEAAEIRLSMLHSRIEMYREGHNCGS